MGFVSIIRLARVAHARADRTGFRAESKPASEWGGLAATPRRVPTEIARRFVYINVDNDGCCHNGWDNDYHPVAAAAAVTATAAIIGSMVRTVPVNYGGVAYQQCGRNWYQSQGNQYVVINPP